MNLTGKPKLRSVNRLKARASAWEDSISLLLALVPGDIRHTGDIDETFFGLPILVMVELSSGYIFSEVESDDRTYLTWQEQIQSWWTQTGWHCHFDISGVVRLARPLWGISKWSVMEPKR